MHLLRNMLCVSVLLLACADDDDAASEERAHFDPSTAIDAGWPGSGPKFDATHTQHPSPSDAGASHWSEHPERDATPPDRDYTRPDRDYTRPDREYGPPKIDRSQWTFPDVMGSDASGKYSERKVSNYVIRLYEDGRVLVTTPAGDTCAKQLSAGGFNVSVQIRERPADAHITVNGVVMVHDGQCA